MVQQTEDGSFLDENGKVLYFSADRFIRDIVEGDCCFICGVSPKDAEFDREHVLSDWILAKYQLYGSKIGLPNDADYTYGRYTVPCCKSCNSRMSKMFETPISKLISDGYNAIQEHLMEQGPLRLFTWLALIFLKTHLKDRELRFHLDARKGDEKISEGYAWEQLHHVHCVARSFYSGAALDPGVFGSLLVLPAKTGTLFGDFDYADLYRAQTLLLHLGEVAFLAVLNDSCAALNVIQPMLKGITGPLSPAQLRELMAHLAYINVHLTERPSYSSHFGPRGEYYMLASFPAKVAYDASDRSDLGLIMDHLCRHYLDLLTETQRDEARKALREGGYTFLYRADGSFAASSV